MLVVACLVIVSAGAASASNLYYDFGPYFSPNDQSTGCSGAIFTPYATGGSINASCNTLDLNIQGISSTNGQVAGISINAPSGVSLDDVRTPQTGAFYTDAYQNGWASGMHWGNAGGYTGNSTFGPNEGGFYTGQMAPGTTGWGFWVSCTTSTCGNGGANTDVGGIYVDATENRAPDIAVDGSLWSQNGWVWNASPDQWPVHFTSDDPTGVCDGQVALGGTSGSDHPQSSDPHRWHECPAMNQT
ncbi:MAG: hypothetical protein J2O48_05785, partial [Solirubrobacterales bacterium]|nr:hypothetical protein [Solirubrobacterales bacterium]